MRDTKIFGGDNNGFFGVVFSSYNGVNKASLRIKLLMQNFLQ